MSKLLTELKLDAESDFAESIREWETYDLLVLLMTMSEELGEATDVESPSLSFQPGERAAILEELDTRIIEGTHLASRKIL